MMAPKSDIHEEHLRRVRRVCAALPEASEKLSHGEPTFFVRKKVFAMFSNNHHNDGHVAVLIPAAPGLQAVLINESPKTFYKPSRPMWECVAGSASSWIASAMKTWLSTFVKRGD